MEEKTIVINHETLFEMLRLERSRTELQKLPDSYIGDVKTMIDSGLAESMTNEEDKKKKDIHIKNTLKIINELYERREKKIVNLALDKSKTKSAIIDFSRLLQHEKEMFYEILTILDKRREDMNNDVLVLKGDLSKDNSSSQGIQEKDLLETADTEEKNDDILTGDGDLGKDSSLGIQGENSQDIQGETLEEPNTEKKDMRTVRFLSPVPRFLGPELEEYGPFDEEYIANLPSKIVDILVEKGRAEEIVVSD